jgi:hypothetical protein
VTASRLRRIGASVAALTVITVGASCSDSADDVERSEPAATVSRPTTTTAAASASTTTKPAAKPTVDVCAYRGLGTWVDVYDTEPAFANTATPPVSPADVDEMHAHGVRTLYLQVAKDDPRSPGVITNPDRARAVLRRAHARGMRVVAWYLPTHRDAGLDLRRARALVKFTADGRHFDGIALDIEPHALPAWKTATPEARRALLEDYLLTCAALRQFLDDHAARDLTISAALAYWLDLPS